MKKLKTRSPPRKKYDDKNKVFRSYGLNYSEIIKYFQSIDNENTGYRAPHQFVKGSTKYNAGDKIHELGACNNCHFYGETNHVKSDMFVCSLRVFGTGIKIKKNKIAPVQSTP